MLQSIQIEPGIGNLNNGISELEGNLNLIKKANLPEEEKQKKIQSLVIKINNLKQNSSKPFF